MADEQQRAADKARYEKILSDWEQLNFIRPGWRIYWDGGEGCHRLEFQTTSRTVYLLTESAMDYYVVGAADMRQFLRSGG